MKTLARIHIAYNDVGNYVIKGSAQVDYDFNITFTKVFSQAEDMAAYVRLLPDLLAKMVCGAKLAQGDFHNR